MLNISTLLLSVERTLFQIFYFICSDAIKQPCCHVLFRERRLSSDNPSKQAIYVQCFSNSLQRTLSFNILTVELESFLTNIIQ